jgi:hypothetical protein
VKLFCPATNAFYPDVTECSQQWLQVQPNSGAAPAPQRVPPQQYVPQQYVPQQNVPQSMPQSYVPQSAPRTVRPAAPNGSRGYEVNAATASPYMYASVRSESMAAPARVVSAASASMPISASASVPERDATPLQVASDRPRMIAAPRAELPRMATTEILVAQGRID